MKRRPDACTPVLRPRVMPAAEGAAPAPGAGAPPLAAASAAASEARRAADAEVVALGPLLPGAPLLPPPPSAALLGRMDPCAAAAVAAALETTTGPSQLGGMAPSLPAAQGRWGARWVTRFNPGLKQLTPASLSFPLPTVWAQGGRVGQVLERRRVGRVEARRGGGLCSRCSRRRRICVRQQVRRRQRLSRGVRCVDVCERRDRRGRERDAGLADEQAPVELEVVHVRNGRSAEVARAAVPCVREWGGKAVDGLHSSLRSSRAHPLRGCRTTWRP